MPSPARCCRLSLALWLMGPLGSVVLAGEPAAPVPGVDPGSGGTPPFRWYRSPPDGGAVPPVPPSPRRSALPPDYLRSVNGREHPEAFPDDEVGATAVRLIQSMQQRMPGPPVRDFLVRQVGLSGPEAEAALVRLAMPEVVEPPPDPRERSRIRCERLSSLRSVEEWVVEIRRLETEDRVASGDPAARGWARLDAAERAKLLAWAHREVRPGMNRTSIDYDLLLRKPGAMDGMRTMICNLAAGKPPAP